MGYLFIDNIGEKKYYSVWPNTRLSMYINLFETTDKLATCKYYTNDMFCII